MLEGYGIDKEWTSEWRSDMGWMCGGHGREDYRSRGRDGVGHGFNATSFTPQHPSFRDPGLD